MIFIKFLLISILIQNLIGCSTHNIKGCPDANTINSETKFSKSLIKTNTPEKAVIENNIYSKHSSGIHSAQFNDASLKLNMLDKDYIYSYKTSQLSVIERTTYQAYEECYKDKFVRNEPIYDVKEPIGYEWRDTKSKHNILVSGFDKDYEFFTYGSMDLSFAILNGVGA